MPEEFDLLTEEIVINMGPQHPSTHGVLRLILRTDGEVVREVQPEIGYLHRCAEKIGENLTVRQFTPYTDRLDYLAAMNMNLGWSLCVEKLLSWQVPEKCRHLRVLMAELNRIASHLVAVGTYGLDLGNFTPYMYCFREREKIVNLFEAVCGARLTYHYIVPGGVMGDLPPGWLRECSRFLDQFQATLNDLHALLTNNYIFIRRTAGVGVLPLGTAISYGCTGPVLRASGLAWDLRRHGEPIYTQMYAPYDFQIVAPQDGQYPDDGLSPPVPDDAVVGDCWHRFYVRMREIVQSVRIVRQAIQWYQEADGSVGEPMKIQQKLPVAEAYLETEAPKGQLGFLIVGQGASIPRRVRIRSSSFCNLSVLPELCRGCLVADVPAIVGSLDLVLGEVDR